MSNWPRLVHVEGITGTDSYVMLSSRLWCCSGRAWENFGGRGCARSSSTQPRKSYSCGSSTCSTALTLSLLHWLRLPSVDGHSLITSDSWAPGTSFAEIHASINVMHTNLWGISTRQSTASGRDAHVDSEARRFPQRCNFPRSS